jgi:anti-sigma regulatory factor (Ser/Thr protein kinase)
VDLHLNTALAPTARTRRDVLDYLRRTARPDSDFEAAESIVGELLANVVRHAPGDFDLRLRWDRGYAVLEMHDRGPAFDYPRPLAQPLAIGGHGLRLVATLAREVIVRRERNGNVLSVVLPVYGPA